MAQTICHSILTGFNPDPSICRVGEDYYAVTSTFEWFAVHLCHRPLQRTGRLLLDREENNPRRWVA